jgi:hypothetical protein
VCATVAIEVLRDSTFAGFMALRAEVLAADVDTFADPFLDIALARLAFKGIDLGLAALRLATFLSDLVLGFAFIAISPATYTGYVS